MLASVNRIKKKKEFSYIYRKGETFYSKNFVLYVVDTKNKQSKIGFSINNKVGNSVERHKIKRRLSEIVRGHIKNLKVKNYILVAKLGSKELSFDDLRQEITDLLVKAKAL